MRDDVIDRGSEARLGDPRGDPRIDLATQVIAPQPLTLVGHRQLALRLPATLDLLRHDPSWLLPEGVIERHVGQVRITPLHPGVHRRQAVARNRQCCICRRQPGLDQPPERAEVVRPPVALPLGRGGTDRIDGPQRVGHDRAPSRHGGAAPVDEREDHASGVTHGPSLSPKPVLRTAGRAQDPRELRPHRRGTASRAHRRCAGGRRTAPAGSPSAARSARPPRPPRPTASAAPRRTP